MATHSEINPTHQDYYEEESGRPRHLLALLSKTGTLYEKAQRLDPDLLQMSEITLEERLKAVNTISDLPRTFVFLKISFWDEYRSAMRMKRVMTLAKIRQNICSHEYFMQNIVENKWALAWILSPPADELLVQRELLKVGYDRMREVMHLPFYEKKVKRIKDPMTGKLKMQTEKVLNVQLIKVVHDMVKTLEDRINGSIVQRQQVEGKNVNLNVDAGRLPTADAPDLESLEKIEEKINELKNLVKPGEGHLLIEQGAEALIGPNAEPESDTIDAETVGTSEAAD